MKFDKDTKLSREVNYLEAEVTLREDLDRLEGWADKNLMKFNQVSGLTPGKIFRSTAQAGTHLSVEQLCGKGPGGPGDDKLSVSAAAVAQRASRARLHQQGHLHRDTEVNVPLIAYQATPGTWCLVLAHTMQKDVDRLESHCS